jgi:CTP:molybdopterin cytidylyltransferase MocA
VTVGAAIFFARLDGALADAAGRPAARRIVEVAWAGGATPIVVVSFDRDSQVATSLAGSTAILAEPAPIEQGPVGQFVRGLAVARESVAETDACLFWPGRMTWVDAETVTTLIEAHGAHGETILRPRYSGIVGWPALLPMAALDLLANLAPDLMPNDILHALVTRGMPQEIIDTGDPGVAHDIATPLAELPDYQGPPEPVSGPAPEWGAAAADTPDDAPLEGPALAPYDQSAGSGS